MLWQVYATLCCSTFNSTVSYNVSITAVTAPWKQPHLAVVRRQCGTPMIVVTVIVSGNVVVPNVFCDDVKFIILITSRQHHHYEVTKSTVASLMFMSTKTIVSGSTTHTVALPIARLVRQWPGSVVSITRATVRIDSILAYVAAGACPSEHYLAVNTVRHVAVTQFCLTFVFAIKGKCIWVKDSSQGWVQG